MTTYTTEQEAFWASQFGDDYTERNQGARLQAANLSFFGRVVARTTSVRSVLELGANRGLNLHALRELLPGVELAGCEINAEAASILERDGFRVYKGSILELKIDTPRDLVFTKGVLIHIDPEALPRVYDLMYQASSRYILIAEYYNPSPVEISYRGHTGKLFKRDFAGELLDRHSSLQLVDYGFLYRRDPNFQQDDISWFLLEKR
ncbi:hypothetical protein AKJ09_07815 [Labilithrix luteola]|uniref:Pseudaminic acid biosynthesis-associated methylase n=1 Tax=Labilithrix luteola TaxID=1391654 RepID=A0A0K1Q655_9BACT|nr:pseudaminic acid biosynthesis-associated methylase [Labilithrix luteola]AKV01152.1 hypothetical protein AKJ09_07815 [Labilithrix luteola]